MNNKDLFAGVNGVVVTTIVDSTKPNWCVLLGLGG